MASDSGSWFIIKDNNSSPLFGGDDIYCFVTSMDIAGAQNIGNSPVIGVNTEIDSSLDSSDSDSIGSMYDRRMGYNSYSGFENPIITLDGTWVVESGSESGVGSLLNPFKLLRMTHSDHQFIIKGGNIINNLVDGECGSSYYNGEQGIPVIFKSPWKINENYKNGTNLVKWSITLVIDRRE